MQNTKDVIKMRLEELKEEKKKVDLKHPEAIGVKWIERAAGGNVYSRPTPIINLDLTCNLPQIVIIIKW